MLSLNLDKSLVDEGSALVASGRSVGGAVGEIVTVTWGDGATSTVALNATKNWQATHTYVDDAGSGTATTYTVKAVAPEHDEAVRQVAVVNVAPQITDLILPTTPVEESDSSTISGTVLDPGTLDTHTVVIDWGDGSAPVPVPVVARAFTATHRYTDDNPSATNQDVMPVSVVVKDKDNASTDEFGTQTVANTPAYGLSFAPRERRRPTAARHSPAPAGSSAGAAPSVTSPPSTSCGRRSAGATGWPPTWRSATTGH